MEHKLGERIIIEVVKNDKDPDDITYCKDCFFYQNSIDCFGLKCQFDRRDDKENIIYKQVKE